MLLEEELKLLEHAGAVASLKDIEESLLQGERASLGVNEQLLEDPNRVFMH